MAIKINPDLIYPVGSVYISTVNINPSEYFGGTWEQIKDVFLLAAGSTYNAGSTGGKAQLELTAAIGAYNNNADTIGYIGVNASTYQQSHKPLYIVTGTLQNYSNCNHGTVVTEQSSTSRYTNNMPPYLVVYMWKRIA